MYEMAPWWACGPLCCFPEDLAFTLKQDITLLHFTREMRAFSFPYLPSQKEEERSWDNKTICSSFHQLPAGGRFPLSSCSHLLGSGGVGSTGWCVGCTLLKDYSELLLLSPPRPFAFVVTGSRCYRWRCWQMWQYRPGWPCCSCLFCQGKSKEEWPTVWNRRSSSGTSAARQLLVWFR